MKDLYSKNYQTVVKDKKKTKPTKPKKPWRWQDIQDILCVYICSINQKVLRARNREGSAAKGAGETANWTAILKRNENRLLLSHGLEYKQHQWKSPINPQLCTRPPEHCQE